MQLLLKGLLKSIECCKLVLMPELSNEQDACKMVLFQIPNMPETICGFGETDDDTKLSIKLHDPHAVHVLTAYVLMWFAPGLFGHLALALNLHQSQLNSYALIHGCPVKGPKRVCI